MNECFFCGPTDSPLTKEHVWPRWVSRLLRGRYNSDHFRQLRAVGDNTTANRSSPQDLNVTTETVCSGCNNEWLSIFENDQIKPLASPLIIGRDAAALTPESQSLLAAWAYKMAMLMDIAHPDKTGEFFTPAERLLFRQTTSAHPLLRVFLGRYNFGWRPAHAHTPRPHGYRRNRRSANVPPQALYDNGWAPCNAGRGRSFRRIERARASERDIRDLRRCKSCGDPDLAYCAGIGFVASGSYDEPSRH